MMRNISVSWLSGPALRRVMDRIWQLKWMEPAETPVHESASGKSLSSTKVSEATTRNGALMAMSAVEIIYGSLEDVARIVKEL